MSIISWFKGKKKQREMRKLEPDKDFEFKENYYGITNDTISQFKFVYCNNYTDNLYKMNKNHLSFISCKLILPNTEKILADICNFTNTYISENLKEMSAYEYNHFYIEMNYNHINIYIRGELVFYRELCDNIHNNIITKYIKNNIFPDNIPIETPNEFLHNIYNSITNPFKPIDILFIEDNIECKYFKPVIGLSIKDGDNNINTHNYNSHVMNNRVIIYTEINKLSQKELDYIIENVKYGNKLLDILHKGIESDDIDLDIDEIIED